MSTTITPTATTSNPSAGPVATASPEKGAQRQASTRRPLAVLGGLALGIAPLLLVGGNLTCPPQDSNSAVDYVKSLARDPFLTHVSGTLYHYGWVLFAFGLLAAIGLVRGTRGRVLTLLGGLGGAFGAIQISGLVLADWFNSASGQVVGSAKGGTILEHVDGTSFDVWMTSGQIGAVLVPALLFLGLARAGVISWWIAPLALLGFAGGPIVGGLVGAGTAGMVISTIASLVFNLPVFVTAMRLVTRGRTDTVTA